MDLPIEYFEVGHQYRNANHGSKTMVVTAVGTVHGATQPILYHYVDEDEIMALHVSIRYYVEVVPDVILYGHTYYSGNSLHTYWHKKRPTICGDTLNHLEWNTSQGTITVIEGSLP